MEFAKRRNTPIVKIGTVTMGSGFPIVVQSMTNTLTSDIPKTVAQIKELADAGSELVRLTINNEEAARAIPEIASRLQDDGYTTPLVGDFHYNGHILLTQFPKTAELLAKYRINPGNVGSGTAKEDHFATIIRIAKDLQKPIRIGVNFGSIDQKLFTKLMSENALKSEPKSDKLVIYDAMVQSALTSAAHALTLGLTKNQLVLSVKMSTLQDMVMVNRQLAQQSDYALHIGLTEAGGHIKGITASAAALGILLAEGIGDTIRVSLTPEPGLPRSQEVSVCNELIQALGLRFFKPSVTSCPGCGRTQSDYFMVLAKEVREYIDQNLAEWKRQYPGVEQLVIAVMGCIVNGPGESKHADIGISLPGANENPIAPVYIEGQLIHRLSGDQISDQFKTILSDYIRTRFSR